MSDSSLGHVPDKRWEFDAGVTAVFDDMLERSIPQYRVMRDAVTALAVRYAQYRTAIVDLGCSRGEAIAPLVERFKFRNKFLGCEVSEPMRRAFLERFANEVASGLVQLCDTDLRTGYPPPLASVTLSVLTLQFTPIEHRQRIVRDVFRHTVDGGAFILVEKVLGNDAELNDDFVAEYYALKRANGYTEDEIERKRLALEGVLVPVTARWNEELLRAAGFTRVDCFWRWMNFAGWVAVRGDRSPATPMSAESNPERGF